jgi:hypothetical protein
VLPLPHFFECCCWDVCLSTLGHLPLTP